MSSTPLQAKTSGTIPKPSSDIFNAIINPDHMRHYFISRASGPLEAQKKISWFFDDYGVEIKVYVKKIVENERIEFQWFAPDGSCSDVAIILEEPEGSNVTSINITESGWPLDEAGAAKAIQQTQGWRDFYCCLKAYLLFDVNLRLGLHVKRDE